MRNQKKGRLIIIAKAPIQGEVKTRLAKKTGKKTALHLHLYFLSSILKTAQNSYSWETELFLPKNTDPLKIQKSIFSVQGPQVKKWVQTPQKNEADLGSVLRKLLKKNNRWPILFLGADSPSLPASLLRKAFLALQTHDAVTGPTQDGGYYLIGFSKQYLPLLRNIPWGSEGVFETTLQKAEKNNISLAILPPWYDIDTLEDLFALKKRLNQNKMPRFFNLKKFLHSLPSLQKIQYAQK